MNNYHDSRQRALDTFEKKWILGMAVLWDFNVSQIAREGGVDRSTVYRLIRKYGVSRMDLMKRISQGSLLDEAQ